MGRVFCDLSMSLDGFIAGPNDEIDPLHDWLYGIESWRSAHHRSGGAKDSDSDVLQRSLDRTGAIVMGRRFFDLGEEPWGENPPFRMPVFVLTHRPRERIVKGESTFEFVDETIEGVVGRAKETAGDKDVSVGAASIVQQCLRAGLLDEMEIHVIPVLLGQGIRLFDNPGVDRVRLEPTRVIDSPSVTHLSFRVMS